MLVEENTPAYQILAQLLADKELVYKTERGYMVYDRPMSLWLRGL